ncbi:sensor domain-containing protein [Martelella radicis]|uniref:Diguanylate cyclase (GGDEF)-like protein/PAS domain S-box-containing protein n=1 Tax=Martelella radicis TaxID=1397476 RepID=A0A7W6KKS6_9HYPH|nr:GGDEF domain-containing phosphodiesterase [Martelella radicis]MBB4121670.1 diguanylate cyclase (GGDEF)-like protein/PAS domain S-box-containing protein [Martelella radicis]
MGEADLANAMIERSPLAVAVVELDGHTITATNQNFEAIMPGIKADGHSILEWIHKDDHPLLRGLIGPTSGISGREQKREMRIGRRPDGPWRWMLVAATILKDEDPQATRRALFYFIDIHAQKSHELLESERARRWNYALVSSGLGVWDHNYRKQEFFYSQTWRAMRGYASTGATPFSSTEQWLQLVHPEDRDFVAHAIERQKAGDLRYMNFEYRERHCDGHWIWIECRGDAVEYFPDNRPARIIGTDQDVTDRKNAEALLAHTRQRLEMALTTSRIGVFEHDRNTGTVYGDARICEIYGFDDQPESFDIQRVFDLVHPEDLKRTLARSSELVPGGGPVSAEFRIYRENDGSLRHVRHLVRLHLGENGEETIVGINWDVTEEVRLRQDLVTAKQLAEARNFELDRAKSDIEYAALHDYLTALPNRRFLEDELERRVSIAAASDLKVGLLQIDVDDFKGINSTYGHGAGDRVLCHAAQTLLDMSKHNDFVARMGGDEFAMIISYEGGRDKLEQTAKRVLLELAKPISLNDARVRISASIGIATMGNKKADAAAMLRDSDHALKHAKSRGHGQTAFFTPGIRIADVVDRKPSDRLMQAIEQNDFIPFYQPQYDAETFEIQGIETLARWRQSDGSFSEPSSFIPLAQSLNIMNIIDASILAQALEDHRHWRDNGLSPPRLSLNLSPHRLSDPALVPALQRTELPAGTLTFELLESIFLDQQDDVSAYNLKQIRRLGINIDVDDFGTGYTSITGLLKVAPNGLKIARELVLPLTRSHDQRAIVKSIVDIGKTLNIRVIAEGVESRQHARILTDLGCDALQGYWLARPMPADAMETLLRRKMAEASV